MAGINPMWIKRMRQEIKEGQFQSIVLSYNTATQWLITELANKGLPVTVVNLGVGVKRISIAENVCPYCKGRGYLK